MNVSLYQAAAAMNANARWQEVISENLATSSIPGARKQEISFEAIQAGLAQGTKGPNGQIYIPSTHVSMNTLPGNLRATNVPTDLAMEGPGFFEIQLPNGSKAYTRDGEFHLNAQSQLVTKQDYLVMGESGPLQFDPGNSSPMTVSATGDVSQGAELKGKLRLSEFSDPKTLKAIGDGMFVMEGPQTQGLPATASQVRQGFLEGSNTSPTTEMASLITSMRMFEANQRVLQMQDERMGRVIADLGTPA